MIKEKGYILRLSASSFGGRFITEDKKGGYKEKL